MIFYYYIAPALFLDKNLLPTERRQSRRRRLQEKIETPIEGFVASSGRVIILRFMVTISTESQDFLLRKTQLVIFAPKLNLEKNETHYEGVCTCATVAQRYCCATVAHHAANV